MRYAILFLFLSVAVVSAKPPQSIIQAEKPLQSKIPLTNGHDWAHVIMSYEEGSKWAAKNSQYLIVYVGENNKPSVDRGSYIQRAWSPILEGYKAGEVVLCVGENGKLFFVQYQKGGPPTTTQFPSFGDGTIYSSGGFTGGGSCSNGSCGGSSTGFIRRR